MKSKQAVVLAALVFLFAAVKTNATTVWSTCRAVQEGFVSTVVTERLPALDEFCRVAISPPVATTSSATISVSSAIRNSGQTVIFIDGDTSDGITLIAGEDFVVENDLPSDKTIPITPAIPVSVLSDGGAPFTVTGGGPTDVANARRTVHTVVSTSRPEGTFISILAVDVIQVPEIVFAAIRVTVTALGDGKYQLDLDSGQQAFFQEEDFNEEMMYRTFTLVNATEGIFPGFNFEGSLFFYQVRPNGNDPGNSNIEIGFGVDGDIITEGDPDVGIKLIEGIIFENLDNLEARFGQLCADDLNIRTIEGDCNNLIIPAQGSADNPLRRLGGGLDPAYPGLNRSIPSGALQINPRDVSNNLFAMSPGVDTLLSNVKSMSSCIESKTSEEEWWFFCPLKYMQRVYYGGKEEIIPFKGIRANECEELIFVFTGPTCEIEILFKCSGETRLDLGEDPCVAETNRFFSPKACTLAAAEDSVLSNPEKLTDMFFTMAQFIDHDLGLTPVSQLANDQPGFSRISRPADIDELPIEIPEGDFFFPEQEDFPFERAKFSIENELSQSNQQSSYLDGSQIYGVNDLRARLLRSFEGGRLALSDGDLPPFNKLTGDGALGAVVENGPNTQPQFFVVGDTRGNEQPILTVLHIIFLREHNLLADEVAAAFPEFDDERVYQTARAIVLAEYQSIIYNEWLPLLLGSLAPKADDFAYDDTLDATVTAIFTTAAFRFGHSLVGTNVLKLGPGPRESAKMELRRVSEVFFVPEELQGTGLEDLARGSVWHLCKELDHKVVDELRNFLLTGEGFDVGEPLIFDLVSLNIQRARDMGLPTFNNVRRLFGLPAYTEFSQFVAQPNLADLAEEVYEGDIENVDVFFGGMVEEHVGGGQLGETFGTVVSEQFRRMRDGDRFFYKGIKFDDLVLERIPRVNDVFADKITLADIIKRTTGVTAAEIGIRPSVFQL